MGVLWKLKSSGTIMIECLVGLLNVWFVTSMVPVDCTCAYVVPLCKGKYDNCECASFKDISLFSVAGKVYDKEDQRGDRRHYI